MPWLVIVYRMGEKRTILTDAMQIDIKQDCKYNLWMLFFILRKHSFSILYWFILTYASKLLLTFISLRKPSLFFRKHSLFTAMSQSRSDLHFNHICAFTPSPCCSMQVCGIFFFLFSFFVQPPSTHLFIAQALSVQVFLHWPNLLPKLVECPTSGFWYHSVHNSFRMFNRLY